MPQNIDGKLEYSEREKEYMAFLKNPYLEDLLVKEIQKQVVRETDTIKTILLCANGRLVENASKTSFNLIINSSSGAGKDWITEHTLEIIPKKDWVKRTRISEMVFTYWHNPKYEPEWTWDGKIFYNEDINNSVLNSDVFKVMSSTGSTATVLVKQKPIDIEIRGTPVMILTTESASPSREITRRFSIVNLDETIDQSSAIMDKKLELAKTGEKLEYEQEFTKALELLQRVKVKIPFADMIKKVIPLNKASHILMRTHIERFLDFIKASCAFYQFQRKLDTDGYYLAQPEDYDNARIALQKITSNPFMIPLTKTEQKIIDTIKGLPQGRYSAKDLEKYVTFVTDRTLLRKLKKIVGYGLLKIDSEYREDVKRYVIVYEYEPFINIRIPKYEELLKNDNCDANDIIDNCDKVVAERQNCHNCHDILQPTTDNKEKISTNTLPDNDKPSSDYDLDKELKKIEKLKDKPTDVVKETPEEKANWETI